MLLPQVPERVELPRLNRLLRELGFDPDLVKGLSFNAFGIYADIYHVDAEGRTELAGPTEPAISTVWIPTVAGTEGG